jgi:hypothetical protein
VRSSRAASAPRARAPGAPAGAPPAPGDLRNCSRLRAALALATQRAFAAPTRAGGATGRCSARRPAGRERSRFRLPCGLVAPKWSKEARWGARALRLTRATTVLCAGAPAGAAPSSAAARACVEPRAPRLSSRGAQARERSPRSCRFARRLTPRRSPARHMPPPL